MPNIIFKLKYFNQANGVTYVTVNERERTLEALCSDTIRAALPYHGALLSFLQQADVGDSIQMRDIQIECLPVSDDGIVEVDSIIEYYDTEEVYENCTVQVLRNSQTGEESVGWWENAE